MKAVEMLIAAGAKVDFVGGPFGSPLAAAAIGGLLPLRYLAEEQDADHTLIDGEGRSVLHIAACNGDIKAIKYLIQLGLDANNTEAKGWSAIHYAASSATPAALEVLLSSMSPDTLDQSEGCSPLHLACRRNQPQALDLLFTAGFRPYSLVTLDPPREWDLYDIAFTHENRNLISANGVAKHHLLTRTPLRSDTPPKFSTRNFYCDGCLHGWVSLSSRTALPPGSLILI